MITAIEGGRVVFENEIKDNLTVYMKDGKIVDITEQNRPYDNAIDAGGAFVAPGFIDIHIHGAGGYDFLDNTEKAFMAISETCARYGATSIVPTITSSTPESMLSAVKTFEKVKDKAKGANLLGLHFEGPYFALSQKGAQDERFIKAFDKDEYEYIINSTDSILRWSGAPELDGSTEFARFLSGKGIVPCIGHSDAESTTALKAFDDGFTHVTHLYSCTSTVHRRNAFRYAGIVEAAYLNDDMTVEIIADGIHLPADLLKLIYKIKGPHKTALVTDSMRAAGMGDGPSILGSLTDGLEVIVEDGVAKLPDRTAFAGSVASCDRLVRNMINMANVPLTDAVTMASLTPAQISGINTKGRIKAGYDADIVIFDNDINIISTIVGGKEVYKAG